MTKKLQGFGKLQRLSGFSGLAILAIAILISEICTFGLMRMGSDIAGFLWVTFHFVINPVLCVAYSIFNLVQIIQFRSMQKRISYAVLVAVVIAYAGFSSLFIGLP